MRDENFIHSTYPIEVDYDLSVEEAVKCCHLNWANNSIVSSNFSTTRTGKANLIIKLVQFDSPISLREALNGLKPQPFRPAELRELLAFGGRYPHVQRDVLVLGMGFVLWEGGNPFVPGLYGNSSERNLDLYGLGHEGGESQRFMTVQSSNPRP